MRRNATARWSTRTLDRMKFTAILPVAAVASWALILVVGFDGIDGVRSQNVPGYPSDGQLRYYIHLPASVVALALVTWTLSLRYRRMKAVAVLVAVAALIGMPCYLLYYTGGV